MDRANRLSRRAVTGTRQDEARRVPARGRVPRRSSGPALDPSAVASDRSTAPSTAPRWLPARPCGPSVGCSPEVRGLPSTRGSSDLRLVPPPLGPPGAGRARLPSAVSSGDPGFPRGALPQVVHPSSGRRIRLHPARPRLGAASPCSVLPQDRTRPGAGFVCPPVPSAGAPLGPRSARPRRVGLPSARCVSRGPGPPPA